MSVDGRSGRRHCYIGEAKPVTRASRRLILLIAAGGGLVLLILAVRHFWFSLPVGEGPAGPLVPRAAFEQPWTDRPVLLVGIGDSVTAGFGASAGYAYFDRLVANPADEFDDMRGVNLSAVLPDLRTLKLAQSGTTSIEHIALQIPKLESQPDDVLGLVVMTTGGNDIIHDYGRSPPREGAMYGATLAQAQPWIAAFDGRLGQMLDRIDAAFPGGCHVFLANIYDPTDGVGDVERAGLPAWPDGSAILAAYNRIIANQAAQRPNVHLIDMHAAFLGHGIHCTQFWRSHYRWGDPHYWYFENLEDPNDRGYDAIRRLFLLELAEVLGPT